MTNDLRECLIGFGGVIIGALTYWYLSKKESKEEEKEKKKNEEKENEELNNVKNRYYELLKRTNSTIREWEVLGGDVASLVVTLNNVSQRGDAFKLYLDIDLETLRKKAEKYEKGN